MKRNEKSVKSTGETYIYRQLCFTRVRGLYRSTEMQNVYVYNRPCGYYIYDG